MAVESITLYKLIILYMLEKVDFPLSNEAVSGFFFETGYADFATVQQVLGIIQDDGLIEAKNSRSSTGYFLTSQGREMFGYFGGKISDEIKHEIDAYLTSRKYELKQSANVTSEFYRNTSGEYSVHCCIKEKNSSLIDITLDVPDESVADTMCGKWRDKSQEIYEFVMKTLM